MEPDPRSTLKHYVDLTNSERQAIWARNASMLVANSFIISALRSDMAGNNSLNIAFSGAGVVICALWAVMIWQGWGHLYFYMDRAKALPLDAADIPFDPTAVGRFNDTIFWCTVLLIGVFTVMYLLSMIHFVCAR